MPQLRQGAPQTSVRVGPSHGVGENIRVDAESYTRRHRDTVPDGWVMPWWPLRCPAESGGGP